MLADSGVVQRISRAVVCSALVSVVASARRRAWIDCLALGVTEHTVWRVAVLTRTDCAVATNNALASGALTVTTVACSAVRQFRIFADSGVVRRISRAAVCSALVSVVANARYRAWADRLALGVTEHTVWRVALLTRIDRAVATNTALASGAHTATTVACSTVRQFRIFADSGVVRRIGRAAVCSALVSIVANARYCAWVDRLALVVTEHTVWRVATLIRIDCAVATRRRGRSTSRGREHQPDRCSDEPISLANHFGPSLDCPDRMSHNKEASHTQLLKFHCTSHAKACTLGFSFPADS
jgi:hypothetical protein